MIAAPTSPKPRREPGGHDSIKRIAVVLTGVLCIVAAAAAHAAPLEVYGKLPKVEQVAISRDGQYLAIAATDGEQRTVAIEQAADHKIIAVVRAGERKVRALQWAGSNHVLITVSALSDLGEDILFGSGEHYGVVDFNLTARKQTVLLNDMPGAVNAIFLGPETRIIDGKPYAFVAAPYFNSDEAGPSSSAVFRVDLDKGQTKVAQVTFPHPHGVFIDADGEVTGQSLYDAASGRWSLRVKTSGDWREVKTVVAPIERPGIAGVAYDGRSILLDDHVDGEQVLRELAPGAADWGPPIHVGRVGLITDGASGALQGLETQTETGPTYSFADPKLAAYMRAAAAAYPGQMVRYVDGSGDRRKLVVLVDSPTEGPAYALVDLDARHASWISSQYAVTPADIGEKRPIHFKAADGLDLTGFLTLPPGKPAKNLPLVVLVHQGPDSHDRPGFDWWAQGIASRGYAVLQINYRGSTDLGWKLTAAGFGEWGHKMQTDLSDGVRYLAAEGIIDPRRVCIAGADYGGYAALAGAAQERGVYRCAASVNGVSDLQAMANSDRQKAGRQGAAGERYWLRYWGVGSIGDPALHSLSPANQADSIDIPVLLIHGKDDVIAPLDQSRRMADALKTAHKPVEFIVLDGEDHWLSRGETRLRMLRALTDFLQKNNPPG